jgi:putative transposase
MRKEQFGEEHYYHIYNRGVDKRSLFISEADRLRFVNTLYVFNNFQEIPRRFNIYTLDPQELLVRIDPLVEIVAGCLMPNHFHLMLSPRRENGISKFMHKIGTSYTKYFNIKHERKGRLFESVYQAKHVAKQDYALYLTQYIHLNPVGHFYKNANMKKTLKNAENYQWSTLPDFLGRKSRFSIMLSSGFRDEILDMNVTEYRELLKEVYLEKMSEA